MAPNRTKKKTKASSSPTTNRFASLQDFLLDADDDVDDDEVDLDENEKIEIEFHPDTSLECAVAKTAGKIQAITILRKKSPGPEAMVPVINHESMMMSSTMTKLT